MAWGVPGSARALGLKPVLVDWHPGSLGLAVLLERMQHFVLRGPGCRLGRERTRIEGCFQRVRMDPTHHQKPRHPDGREEKGGGIEKK